MKRKGCLVLMLLASMVLSAQSDFEKYVQQEKRAYQKFIDKRNADYAQFLQQSWEAYQAYQGQQPPQNPLPPKPQIYQPEQIQQGQESVKSDTAESLISRPLKQRLFEQD